MKKIMVVGKIACGKTTICQYIHNISIHYKKTQAVEIIGNSLDTPGEYLEHKKFCQALIVYAQEADIIILLQDVTAQETSFSPRMQCMFHKPMIGVITKMDLLVSEEQRKTAETFLQFAGADPIFAVSSYTGEGMYELLAYLNDDYDIAKEGKEL